MLFRSGNGIGVAGVNWHVKLISGKFLGAGGGTTSGAILAIDYLTMLKRTKGLNIVATSNSWGGGGFTQALLDAIDRGGDAGILFVAAAGNGASNNDSLANYPSNYECTKGGTRGWDCLIAVAAIDSAGNLASFSNYSSTKVDLGAPDPEKAARPSGHEGACLLVVHDVVGDGRHLGGALGDRTEGTEGAEGRHRSIVGARRRGSGPFRRGMASRVGFEPTTWGLKVPRSAAELPARDRKSTRLNSSHT